MRPTLEIYAAAVYLREDTDAWTEFCREEKWATFRGKKPSPDTAGNALRFAFRFAYGFDDAAATKRASKDARMLESAFARRLSPAQAAAEVEAAGGKEAYSQAQQRARGEATDNPEPTIKLIGGEHLDGLSDLKPGRKVRLLLKVHQVLGSTIVAKGLRIVRVRTGKRSASHRL